MSDRFPDWRRPSLSKGQRRLRNGGVALLLLVACGGPETVLLPMVPEAKGWALLDELESGFLFSSEEAISLPDVRGTRLVAFPVSPAELGLRSGAIETNSGRPISALASFAFVGGGWASQDPLRVELPFSPSACASLCLKQFECLDCGVVPTTQGCGPCAPPAVTPPEDPTRDCPAGWQRTEKADGHMYCSVNTSPQIAALCGPGERWSMQTEGCVAFASCRPPNNAPVGAVFVDPAAAAGGDGSAAAPLRIMPALDRPQTVVLAPGIHATSATVDAADVVLLGHGACSQLQGVANQDVLTVRARGAVINGLMIQASGTGRAVVVEFSGDANVSAAWISAEDIGVSSTGELSLEDVYVERTGLCDSECLLQPAVALYGAAQVANSDIYGPTGILSGLGSLVLRQTRLLSSSLGGAGLLHGGEASVTVAEVAAIGFGQGLTFSAQSELRATLSDLVVRTTTTAEADALDGRGLVFMANESLPSTLTIQRVDIRAQKSGIVIEGAEVVLEDIRIDGPRTAIVRGPPRATSQLTARRLWLDVSRFGLAETGRGLTVLEDVWLSSCRGCPPREVGGFVAPVISGPGRLQARRLHLLAGGFRAIGNYDDVSVDDLLVRGATSIPPVRGAVNAKSNVEGARWDIEAQGIGLGTDGTFDLSDVRIAPDTPTSELTPICLYRLSQGRLRGFELSRTSSRASIYVFEPAFRELPLDTLRFEAGHVLPDRLVEATDDCITLGGVLDGLPVFDEVLER